MPRYVHRSRFPVSRETLFAWHERPGAFERLAPPWQRIEVVRREGGIRHGARITLRMSLLGPLAVRWEIEHRDYERGRRFRDVQRRGPFRRWVHTHSMHDDADGSLLEDSIDFALHAPVPFAASYVKGQLRRLFAHRHRVTHLDLSRHAEHADRGTLTVLVSGASGLIGSALAAFLGGGGHTVRRLVRGDPRASDEVRWDPMRGALDPRALEGVDAVVHLAGAPIAERWTEAHKREVTDSRVLGTRLLADAIAKAERKPRVFVSASAIGFYGDRGDEVLDERSPSGTGFLAETCRAWEGAADAARAAGVRVVHPRFGVVLSPKGGALARLLPVFRLGMGGRIGDGRNWGSWIALDDAIGALHHLLMRDDLEGPVNVVAPAPATNREQTSALAELLHRPKLATVPPFALRLMFGEMAEEVLLASQRVMPRKLLASGFVFRHPELREALRFELGL